MVPWLSIASWLAALATSDAGEGLSSRTASRILKSMAGLPDAVVPTSIKRVLETHQADNRVILYGSQGYIQMHKVVTSTHFRTAYGLYPICTRGLQTLCLLKYSRAIMDVSLHPSFLKDFKLAAVFSRGDIYARMGRRTAPIV